MTRRPSGERRNVDYPEYREARWNAPEGDLFGDQRHRARVWGTYNVPLNETVGAVDVSLLYGVASGTPFVLTGATTAAPGLTVGQINPRPYVVNPGYANPLGNTTTVEYVFFPRDEYRTETQHRTDFSVNYTHKILGRSEVFFHGEVLNIFNQFQLCGCGGTVFNNGGGSDIRQISTAVQVLQAFDPFTVAPVEGVQWRKNPTFGQATSRFAYTSPRTFRFNVGRPFPSSTATPGRGMAEPGLRRGTFSDQGFPSASGVVRTATKGAGCGPGIAPAGRAARRSLPSCGTVP